MKITEIDFIFKVIKRDRWNNPFVNCPVCNDVRKYDGIMKHLNSDKEHLDFIHRHKLKKKAHKVESV